MQITGYSERTVQQADRALLLGVVTEVMRGRLRTIDERQARGLFGWTSPGA